MRLKLWMFVLLACAAAPSAVARAKLAGKVLDAAAFSKVKTYCVDTSNRSGADALDVPELMKRESGPKGLLSKLPWKLEADCSAPGVDAILRFDFSWSISNAVRPGPPEGSPSALSGLSRLWRAQLQLSDKAPSRVIYKAEANSLDNDQQPTVDDPRTQLDHTLRQNAAYHALAALVSDVKTASRNP